jgi:hypothetical protein
MIRLLQRISEETIADFAARCIAVLYNLKEIEIEGTPLFPYQGGIARARIIWGVRTVSLRSNPDGSAVRPSLQEQHLAFTPTST